jgi:IS5 family transposase
LARAGAQASGKAIALVAELERTATLVERVAAQTRLRLSGEVPDGSTRIVSLHDPQARPIRKGRIGKPVEFGFKAQVADNVDGVILDWELHQGNPPDAPMLLPAIARIKARFGRAPRAVTADRGYGEAGVDAGLIALGVKRVAIPRRGAPGIARRKVQRGRGFVKLVKWRTGSEARISCLKRDWGWSRTLLDGETGAQTWCGWGVMAHNTAKISRLVGERTEPPNQQPARQRAG